MLLLYYLDSFIVILYYCNYINYYSCVIYFFGNSCRFWWFNYLISLHLFFLRKYWNKKNVNNIINMVYFIIVNNESRSVSARVSFYFLLNFITYLFIAQSIFFIYFIVNRIKHQKPQTINSIGISNKLLNVLNQCVCIAIFKSQRYCLCIHTYLKFWYFVRVCESPVRVDNYIVHFGVLRKGSASTTNFFYHNF